MKKLMLVGLVLCTIAMMFKFGWNMGYAKAKDEETIVCENCIGDGYITSDEEIMEYCIREDFGSDYYGELLDDGNDDVVEFMVYNKSDETECYLGTYELFKDVTSYMPLF